jgi:hypothetical protein
MAPAQWFLLDLMMMQRNNLGEIIFDEDDLCDLAMQGRDLLALRGVKISPDINLDRLVHYVENPGELLTWTFPTDSTVAMPEFDARNQSHWLMPDGYKNIDIAEHVLSLCQTQAQLQRVGEELLLYQEHGLFDLLRYLKYLVDVMRENHVIWGVGRGSSVASYVLYLLGVHRIDSMFYDLDPREFLR